MVYPPAEPPHVRIWWWPIRDGVLAILMKFRMYSFICHANNFMVDFKQAKLTTPFLGTFKCRDEIMHHRFHFTNYLNLAWQVGATNNYDLVLKPNNHDDTAFYAFTSMDDNTSNVVHNVLFTATLGISHKFALQQYIIFILFDKKHHHILDILSKHNSHTMKSVLDDS
jgi:hypothetical protein